MADKRRWYNKSQYPRRGHDRCFEKKTSRYAKVLNLKCFSSWTFCDNLFLDKTQTSLGCVGGPPAWRPGQVSHALGGLL